MIIFQYGDITQAFDHATSEVWGIEPLQSLRSYDLLPQSVSCFVALAPGMPAFTEKNQVEAHLFDRRIPGFL